jgi:regulator of PEP synthase PpsR (kinase-PPPase family)
VANVPLILGVEPPPQLFQVDPRRVVGLTIDIDRLLVHRRKREGRMGMTGSTVYTDPRLLREELREARRIFDRGTFSVIDVTSKPVETTADEIIDLITGKLKAHTRRRPER